MTKEDYLELSRLISESVEERLDVVIEVCGKRFTTKLNGCQLDYQLIDKHYCGSQNATISIELAPQYMGGES